ncbi:nudE neurodevelopment protein 1-like 1 [Pristimantis euphronides]
MDVLESGTFNSMGEEKDYWKDVAAKYKKYSQDAQEELNKFREASHDYEAELEAQLQQTKSRNRDLLTQNSKLQMELESIRKSSNPQHLQSYVTISDAFECFVFKLHKCTYFVLTSVFHRATIFTLEDFELRLNQAIERNAFLECELDEKENNLEYIQRLKDETRDLRHELAVQQKHKMIKRSRSANQKSEHIDVAVQVSLSLPSTPVGHRFSISTMTSPLHCKKGSDDGYSGTPLTTSARISALNIVGDLLQKIGASESKLAACKHFVCDQSPKNPTNVPLVYVNNTSENRFNMSVMVPGENRFAKQEFGSVTQNLPVQAMHSPQGVVKMIL